MKLHFTTLGVFTSTRYQGNPVAIISVPSSVSPQLSQAQKQAIASEFNLSEIVFLHLPEPGTSPEPLSRKIDIFTSYAEVPFAGHPTIGTTHFLLKILKEENITEVMTKAGPISIAQDENTGNVKAEIPFDFHVHSHSVTCALNSVANPVASIVNGMTFIYAELPSLEALAAAKGEGNLNADTYDPSALDEGWQNGLVGTMYFVPQGEDAHGRKTYRTRMFASREDPGTGSASSGLACLLAERAGVGHFKFVFEQGVEMGRRNEITVEVQRGESGIEKVILSGTAVKVMEGTLEI
jgi:PhzF family phenazine biosynthesis protein